MATQTEQDIGQLQFVRCRVPQCIPKELIEAVKGRTFTPEQFYSYQDRNVDNPGNFLFCLINESKRIHGFLWAEQNALDGSLFVNTFSVVKEYWGKGKAIPMVIQFLKELSTKIKASRTYWCTTNEKFFLKQGFRKSKICLMEYNTADQQRASNGPE